MELKDYIYTIVIISHIWMMVRIRMEATTCGWSRQARWISLRFSAVTLSVFLLAIAGWTILEQNDNALEFVMGLGICSMTLILYLHLPDILAAMSDERIGENLNIHINGDELES